MANMNLPGVRRIEALITVLKAKEKEETARVSATLPTRKSIERIVDAEFGLVEYREAAQKALDEARYAYEKIGAVVGREYEVNINTRYYQRRDSAYELRVEALTDELINAHLNEVKRIFKEKESALWLVESVEEAKAIVYGEAA